MYGNLTLSPINLEIQVASLTRGPYTGVEGPDFLPRLGPGPARSRFWRTRRDSVLLLQFLQLLLDRVFALQGAAFQGFRR